MTHRFFDLAFTPAVQAEQVRMGSRDLYAGTAGAPDEADALGPREATFVSARDSFYLASVSETGWPYVQHRGGPAGFARVLDERTIGWAEYAGNRQYVTVGNTAVDDRVCLFLMDYLHRRRLKIMGRLRVHDPAARPDLAPLLTDPGYSARVERFATVAIEAFDWNCPQHITQRFTLAEVARLVEPLQARVAELEAAAGGA